jgi:hypothetical protein
MNMKFDSSLIGYYNWMNAYTDAQRFQNHKFLADLLSNPDIKYYIDLQKHIKTTGALDPANPALQRIINNDDLYYTAMSSGILFYPDDVEYIHNIILTDNIYRILPNNMWKFSSSDEYCYISKKWIVNYEYFLDCTNPPTGARRAILCMIGRNIHEATQLNPHFRKELFADRPFIERWFEKIR